MGWAIGYSGGRDIGYGVPAPCDQPRCKEIIDRGISYACGSFRNDNGCGLYFCSKHLYYGEDEYGDSADFCDRCLYNLKLGGDRWEEFKPVYKEKPDTLKWMLWKLKDGSWDKWRLENQDEVSDLEATVAKASPESVKSAMEEIKEELTEVEA